MPGVGKTQLALKYAQHHRPDYAAGLWVSAASRETLLSGFAALAGVLNLPERNEADQEKIVAAVRRWLDTTDQPWLLILDNADELELLQEFLPSGRGHCLLTTRAQGVRALATPERVTKWNPPKGRCCCCGGRAACSPDATARCRLAQRARTGDRPRPRTGRPAAGA
jgi:hypothetical protein